MKTLTVPAVIAHLPQVMDFIHQQLADTACPPDTILHIDLAVEEMFVNIASYAYGQETGPVRIDYEQSAAPAYIEITITDQGLPFDPLSKSDTDTTLPAEKRNIGGLGIFLTKKVMDSVDYERRNNENIVRLRKSF